MSEVGGDARSAAAAMKEVFDGLRRATEEIIEAERGLTGEMAQAFRRAEKRWDALAQTLGDSQVRVGDVTQNGAELVRSVDKQLANTRFTQV